MLRRLVKVCFWLLVLGAAAALCAQVYIVVVTNASIYNAESVPHEQVALVLGASIKADGELSPVLAERADAAVLLYSAHKVSKILVSGDNSTLQYDEVYPVGKYLLSKGIPQKDIFLDYAGFDTYSSMYRAKYVFGVSSMIIASQRFHLPRALFIARRLGLEAVGVDAGTSDEQYDLNWLRELPATLKAAYDLYSNRQPQYLGATFPVSGDGIATWVGSSTAQMIYFKNGQKRDAD